MTETEIPLLSCSAERAVIEYDPAFWSPEKLAEVCTALRAGYEHRTLILASLEQEIEDMGFEASPIQPVVADTITLQVYGMT